MSMNDDDILRGLADLKQGDGADDLVARSLVDAALEHARRTPPGPSDLLVARMTRDARRASQQRRWKDRMAWTGLAAACLVGLGVGLADPGGLIGGASYAPDGIGGGYEFEFAGAVE
ncbi:hypothetical protein [Palleronia abyssalis]|uniref:Uncharacterized protein n=1 Tax=Palleronia abyssalis TaxID=1501240 RepID=A0A2R8BSA3_9RHOB|nr:hypothetical protein [Palleronia abyssalis]SPJ23013.1 hypothetical protein PAA8504_00817 [Palleronia abyssalis]